MKFRSSIIAICAIASAMAFTLTVAAPPAAAAGQKTYKQKTQKPSGKQRQKQRYSYGPARSARAYAPPPYYGPPPGAYRRPFVGPADPSFAPNGMLYRAPAYLGDCVIDEGYGRFSACSNN